MHKLSERYMRYMDKALDLNLLSAIIKKATDIFILIARAQYNLTPPKGVEPSVSIAATYLDYAIFNIPDLLFLLDKLLETVSDAKIRRAIEKRKKEIERSTKLLKKIRRELHMTPSASLAL